jgi:uncharacterized protein (TIGR03435 family)
MMVMNRAYASLACLRVVTQRSGTALTIGRKCLLFAAGLLFIVAPVGFGALHGQSPAAASSETKGHAWTAGLPKYEVASIKPSSPDARGFMLMMKPAGIDLKDSPVQTLLQLAFGVEPDRIVGAPDWVRSRRFDIEAKVTPEDAPKMEKLKMEQRRAMLLPLLEERFGLKYHHENRELPVYALVVAKGGPKLTESKPGEVMPGPDGYTARTGEPMPSSGGPGPVAKVDGPPGVGNRAIIGEGMRMGPGGIQSRGGNTAFLAHALSGILGRSVVDKTGLTGNYDFSLNWTPDESMRNGLGDPQGGPPKGDAPSDAGGPTLFTAVQEQLGLKLESQKGTVDAIVIDHIDLPTEN